MLNAQAIRDRIQNSLLKDAKAGDDKQFSNPFRGEKSAILQETRAFNETPLNPKKCSTIMTKVMFMLVSGETLSNSQTSDLFFGVTKLFQSTDLKLRRMIYLLIKLLNVNTAEVFIVISSLTKDMNSNNDFHRANALRVLSRIVDSSMTAQIERYLKSALVDRNCFVSSSALVCSLNLLNSAPEVVKRWSHEITECTGSKFPMVQFHSFLLLYELKKSDHLALQKMIGNLSKSHLKTYLSDCLLIRSSLLLAEKDRSFIQPFISYLNQSIRHKNDAVILESARALCVLAQLDTNGYETGTVFGHELLPTVTALQIFLNSSKSINRFAGIRLLSKLSQTHPGLVARCNIDIEPMLPDSNRAISTLALTTLLKTGQEASVERLIKQIASFMSDVSDAFKIEIVRAVKELCLTYPQKYKLLLSFVSSNLREEGSLEFKSDTVSALIHLCTVLPEAQEVGLFHLCEFIEDCEYPSLCTRILAFIGSYTPGTSFPRKYIRFVYNRLILENALVRVAGVDALCCIALKCPDLRNDILVLLKSCTEDNDDEVRERSLLYYAALENYNESIVKLLAPEIHVPLTPLVHKLTELTNGKQNEIVDLSALNVNTVENPVENMVISDFNYVPENVCNLQTEQFTSSQLVEAIAHLEIDLGEFLYSSDGNYLTEKEAEYTVKLTKNWFSKGYVVLDFVITNTLEHQVLSGVEVKLSGVDKHCWKVHGGTGVDKISYDNPESAFIVVEKLNCEELVYGSFGVTLNFTVQEDEDDLGYQDVYTVESLKFATSDYIIPKPLRVGDFSTLWDQLEDHETTCKFSLNFKTLEAAAKSLISSFNQAPCDKTDVLSASEKHHVLRLSGLFQLHYTVFSEATLVASTQYGCLLKLVVRSKTLLARQAIMDSLDN